MFLNKWKAKKSAQGSRQNAAKPSNPFLTPPPTQSHMERSNLDLLVLVTIRLGFLGFLGRPGVWPEPQHVVLAKGPRRNLHTNWNLGFLWARSVGHSPTFSPALLVLLDAVGSLDCTMWTHGWGKPQPPFV